MWKNVFISRRAYGKKIIDHPFRTICKIDDVKNLNVCAGVDDGDVDDVYSEPSIPLKKTKEKKIHFLLLIHFL